MTSLAILMQMETAARRRGTGARAKFASYLPLVGEVCRTAYCKCYHASPATIARYHRRIEEGYFSLTEHGNMFTSNHQELDIKWLVGWFRGFAEQIGDIRERKQEMKNGRVVCYMSSQVYTMLPAYATWSWLHE